MIRRVQKNNLLREEIEGEREKRQQRNKKKGINTHETHIRSKAEKRWHQVTHIAAATTAAEAAESEKKHTAKHVMY